MVIGFPEKLRTNADDGLWWKEMYACSRFSDGRDVVVQKWCVCWRWKVEANWWRKAPTSLPEIKFEKVKNASSLKDKPGQEEVFRNYSEIGNVWNSQVVFDVNYMWWFSWRLMGREITVFHFSLISCFLDFHVMTCCLEFCSFISSKLCMLFMIHDGWSWLLKL